MGNRRSRLNSKRRRIFKGNRYTAVQRKEELEIQRNVCPAESLDAACESSSSSGCSSSVRLRPKPDLPRFTKSAVAGNHLNKDIINEEEDFNMIIYFPILVSMFCQFARCNQEDPGWKTCMNFPTRSCERLDLARCELRADPKIGCELRVKLKLMR